MLKAIELIYFIFINLYKNKLNLYVLIFYTLQEYRVQPKSYLMKFNEAKLSVFQLFTTDMINLDYNVGKGGEQMNPL